MSVCVPVAFSSVHQTFGLSLTAVLLASVWSLQSGAMHQMRLTHVLCSLVQEEKRREQEARLRQEAERLRLEVRLAH